MCLPRKIGGRKIFIADDPPEHVCENNFFSSGSFVKKVEKLEKYFNGSIN